MRANAVIENGVLLDVACDLHGSGELLEDIGFIIGNLLNRDIEDNLVASSLRLIQAQAETWSCLLNTTQKNLETIVGRKVVDDE